eukprot:1908135-Ditylum_brightwellii.AAC.1
MNGGNRTHDTEDSFELNRHAKREKPNMNHTEADKVSYKDLNALVNTKVTTALNKAEKNLRNQKKQKEFKLNAFDIFFSLNAESSNEEDEPNKHAPAIADKDDSSASCLLSDNSDSNVE